MKTIKQTITFNANVNDIYEYLTNPKHNSAFKKSEFPQLPEKKAKGAPEVDNTSWWNLKPKI